MSSLNIDTLDNNRYPLPGGTEGPAAGGVQDLDAEGRLETFTSLKFGETRSQHLKTSTSRPVESTGAWAATAPRCSVGVGTGAAAVTGTAAGEGGNSRDSGVADKRNAIRDHLKKRLESKTTAVQKTYAEVKTVQRAVAVTEDLSAYSRAYGAALVTPATPPPTQTHTRPAPAPAPSAPITSPIAELPVDVDVEVGMDVGIGMDMDMDGAEWVEHSMQQHIQQPMQQPIQQPMQQPMQQYMEEANLNMSAMSVEDSVKNWSSALEDWAPDEPEEKKEDAGTSGLGRHDDVSGPGPTTASHSGSGSGFESAHGWSPNLSHSPSNSPIFTTPETRAPEPEPEPVPMPVPISTAGDKSEGEDDDDEDWHIGALGSADAAPTCAPHCTTPSSSSSSSSSYYYSSAPAPAPEPEPVDAEAESEREFVVRETELVVNTLRGFTQRLARVRNSGSLTGNGMNRGSDEVDIEIDPKVGRYNTINQNLPLQCQFAIYTLLTP